jgi:hypothetical protein
MIIQLMMVVSDLIISLIVLLGKIRHWSESALFKWLILTLGSIECEALALRELGSTIL